MVNKQPVGLKAYNAERRRLKMLQKQVELADDLQDLEKIDITDEQRLDAYMIKLTVKYPNDVKVANVMEKWVNNKRKLQAEKNLLDAEV